MAYTLHFRRDVESEWLRVNPVLEDGELALTKGMNAFKIGNGESRWADLPYMFSGPRGYDLQFQWSGTRLGIKSSNQTEYAYVELKGENGISIKGDKGDTGPGLEFSWDGNKLGVRKMGDTNYTYSDSLKGDVGVDGKSIEFNWQGTQLGIRQSGQQTFSYTDLKGEKGDKGDSAIHVFNNISELTIVSGVVTISGNIHTIDTENDAPTDELVTINGGVANQLLPIRAENPTRVITLKHGVGNIELGGSDLTLDSFMFVLLIYSEALSKWVIAGGAGAGSGGGGFMDTQIFG